MLAGENQDLFLMASDRGYGFIMEFADYLTNYKNGKAVLTLRQGQLPLPPQAVPAIDSDNVLAITTTGRMLIFKLSELPRLKKGKGNKIIHLPPAKNQMQPRKNSSS